VEILARGCVNLEDTRDFIAAIASLVSDAGRDKRDFSRAQSIFFSLDDRLDVSLQDHVDIFGFGMIMRWTRAGIDVDQVDVNIDVLCAVGFID
jgi:hypothetical protein